MFVVRKDKKRKPGIRKHEYDVSIKWTGNTGLGTRDYMSYNRDTRASADNKPDITMSSDKVFLGNAKHWNPEEFLVASLATCHELWYLALCGINNIVVTSYEDHAHGTMIEREDGAGAFKNVTLRPHITIQDEKDLQVAHELHAIAHEKCFIANSVNFEITIDPVITLVEG